MRTDGKWTAYITIMDQAQRDLELHISAMIERMEWENTLPEVEKSKRRFWRLIDGIPQCAEAAKTHRIPGLLLGHLERVIHHCRVIYGDDCFEKAAEVRREWFEADDDE